MKILFIIILSTLISFSGIYILRERIFKVNEKAPDNKMIANENNFYKLSANDIDGNKIDFSQFKGKKLLIVNVASKCGYTSQYKDLQELHKKYNDKVTILAFPSNNFGFQEPGSNDQIEEFCETNYGIEFQLFEKSDVRGKNINSVYRWLSSINDNGWNDKSPRWNFFKYLVDETGSLKAVYSSNVNPMDNEIIDFVIN
ncbi:MAG: glutathione peroxidase [Cytophagales bacterium]|nr:MAG: glutathione peroxidase [Rhodothermaeota bacterium MED-G16]